MSTQPPNPREDPTRATITNMAIATSTTSTMKTKSSIKKTGHNVTQRTKTQMHRRSRTGCYTCRLRRKKCDEGLPMCTACKHLGLCCEYKRPVWWSTNEMRRNQKDDIKMIIKRKKLNEKASHSNIQTSISSPPGLTHSLPTSATFSDPMDRARSASIDSQFPFNFNSPPSVPEYGVYNTDFGFHLPPYEIDVKTERQMFINDVPTLRESTVSTFSTYHAPPPAGTVLSSYPFEGGWTEQVYHERRESLTEETLNTNFFDFSNGVAPQSHQVSIELDEKDNRLLQHFITFVLPTVFPVLDSNQHGDFIHQIMPALPTNPGYKHCLLMIAAQHLKATTNAQSEELDGEIMRHRHATILSLVEALNQDQDHQQILEATLALILFSCRVGRYDDDSLPDIPWHQHFQAVGSLVGKLGLTRLVCDTNEALLQTPFNMTMTAWIDIMGATMQGRAPIFAHTYREKHMSANPSLGLRELMGCDDRVMYLISEIACLEALKIDGSVDDINLCNHVHALGGHIGTTEIGDCEPKVPFNSNGSLSPKQLSKNITSAFRIAARIYLCSLVPGFSPSQASCKGLVEKLVHVLDHIPLDSNSMDKSLSWVYLIGGSVSVSSSSFRSFFASRIAQLGEDSKIGSFGGVVSLLEEIWTRLDNSKPGPGGSEETPFISWREVMRAKGWDYLLM